MRDVEYKEATQGACPFRGTRVGGALGSPPTLEHWWPERLRVELLHGNPTEASPLGPDFDYPAAFATLDLEAVKRDIEALLTSSVSWWPSDYGHYGPQMIRMAWHAAGTYRIADGRGGAGQALQRFAPLDSWWDNGNIDKSRRLLWPIKQKYGAALSWGDLMILTGNCALESMGLPTFGFGGGRVDAWEPDVATWWGPEGWKNGTMVNRDERWQGAVDEAHYDLENPLAATHQALIYVDPEGPNGDGDPVAAARDIRESFARMAMNDEETVALVAGGHAFGKSHGQVPADRVGPAPEGAPIEAMGLGWMNPEGTGFAEYTMTNGIEGSWTPNPIRWDNDYLTNLFGYEWEQTKSPAGSIQWKPVDDGAPKTPDAHRDGVEHPLMMMTTDLAFKVDPDYRAICERFLEDFDAFTDAFSRAWYKLTHRDMGPKSRYLGPDVPDEDLPWQDPLPPLDHEVVDDADITALKAAILDRLPVSDLVFTAWSSASTFRISDKRGGANGARIRLAPQRSWPVNDPDRLAHVLAELGAVRDAFHARQTGGHHVSMADLIVLGGCAAIEQAARDAGHDVTVPFVPGRVDASQDQTDESFDWLQPVADGFRNYINPDVIFEVSPERLFLDRAALLSLSAPEWTVLVGGLRVLDTNFDRSRHGVLTDRPGVLSNDFFVNLTTMDLVWRKADDEGASFTLRDRDTDDVRFTATRCDLIFGSNSQLRAISEVYASSDGEARFVRDFVAAWHKVMMLDRYDVV